MIDVERYLRRIGLTDAVSVDRDGLETLQRAHLTEIPFENLHIAAGIGTKTVRFAHRAQSRLDQFEDRPRDRRLTHAAPFR